MHPFDRLRVQGISRTVSCSPESIQFYKLILGPRPVEVFDEVLTADDDCGCVVVGMETEPLGVLKVAVDE